MPWRFVVFLGRRGLEEMIGAEILAHEKCVRSGDIASDDAIALFAAEADERFEARAEEIGAIAGAIGLMIPATRKAAGWGLALYALCVWPANVQHMLLDLARPEGLSLAYHVPRLAAQPLVIWLALWTGAVIDWPFRRR